MYWQATVHILIRGAKTQDEACNAINELFSLAPLAVVDWAYTQDRSGTALFPIPRPDLKDLGYEEGEFLSGAEPLHPCPYCLGPTVLVKNIYDQGYSVAVWWCPNCEARQVIKNYPPEEDPNGS